DAGLLEAKAGALDRRPALVDRQDLLGARLQRLQRPEPVAAGRVEHAPPGQRAAGEGKQRLEEGAALRPEQDPGAVHAPPPNLRRARCPSPASAPTQGFAGGTGAGASPSSDGPLEHMKASRLAPR